MVSNFVKAVCDAALWQTSPNNIHGLGGVELLGREPRSIDIPFGLQVRVRGESIVILRQIVTPRPGTDFLDFTFAVVAVCATVPEAAGVLRGWVAHSRDAVCIPACDGAAIDLIRQFNAGGTSNALRVLDGWLLGWHARNIALA